MTGAKPRSGLRRAASGMGGCCGENGFTNLHNILYWFFLLHSSFVEFHTAHAFPRHPPHSPLFFSPLPKTKILPSSRDVVVSSPQSSSFPRSKERTRKHFWDASFPLPPSTAAAVALAVASHAFPPSSHRRSLIHLDQVEEVGAPSLPLFLLTNVTQRLCCTMCTYGKRRGIVRTVRAARERTNLFPRQKFFHSSANSDDCFKGN